MCKVYNCMKICLVRFIEHNVGLNPSLRQLQLVVRVEAELFRELAVGVVGVLAVRIHEAQHLLHSKRKQTFKLQPPICGHTWLSLAMVSVTLNIAIYGAHTLCIIRNCSVLGGLSYRTRYVAQVMMHMRTTNGAQGNLIDCTSCDVQV